MSSAHYSIPRHPVWPTVLIMLAGAIFGALIGVALAFMASVAAILHAAPMALYLNAPVILALSGLAGATIVAITPVWGLVGGALFAHLASGRNGVTANAFGVTLFSEEHEVSQAVRRMTEGLGIPPVAYVGWYDAEDINAFAAGTSGHNAMIAISRGALEQLPKDQLDAVVAHELGHVASNDMARMTYAQGVQNSLTFFLVFRGLRHLARWVFTPLSQLEILRFSRHREFTADAISSHITSPEAMIGVLKTLQNQTVSPRTCGRATIMMSARFGDTWFSTHPPLEKRIAALQALSSRSASVKELKHTPGAPAGAVLG